MRTLQIDKLRRLRAERDEATVTAALEALSRAAASGDGNLLELGVEAARAKATVGEISAALEKVLGRHRAEIRAISGVYKREVGAMSEAIERVRRAVEAFERDDGRRPRILVAKMGQDGHDRGQKVIASAFADLGFDVDIGPLFATPGEAARQAIENDVHIVGVSSLAAGHLTLVPELKRELVAYGRPDIMIVVGGVVPPQDFEALGAAGASAIFPPGTVIAEAAEKLIAELNARLGYASAAGRRIANRQHGRKLAFAGPAKRPRDRAVDEPQSSSPSLVELRRHGEAVALGLVVIDPELRLLLRQHVGDALHRGERLVLVGVVRRARRDCPSCS